LETASYIIVDFWEAEKRIEDFVYVEERAKPKESKRQKMRKNG
jgi:hypothetical protein